MQEMNHKFPWYVTTTVGQCLMASLCQDQLRYWRRIVNAHKRLRLLATITRQWDKCIAFWKHASKAWLGLKAAYAAAVRSVSSVAA